MKQEIKNYTCPYCRWTKHHTPAHIREEEELIKREYAGQDYTNTYWRETKKKYQVYACEHCQRNLKIRSRVIWSLFACGMVGMGIAIVLAFVERFYSSPLIDTIAKYSIMSGLAILSLLALIWILWKILGPSRVHVKYNRAKECNAIVPQELDPQIVALAQMLMSESSDSEPDKE